MLTVLFATRDGARTLPGVLEAYCRLEQSETKWKLVVVDNGSTDRTSDIVRSFCGRLPLIYRYEAAPGKNAALNSGLESIEGDLVVLTDDDAFPRPDWLIRLRAAADTHASYSIFGGSIVPRWEKTPPGWLRWVHAGPVFTLTSPSLVDGPVAAYDIFGPNMAVRADVFRKGARFDVSIGPRGADYAMGSETELVRRLIREGCKAWHVRDAIVEHFIREFQMTRSWVLGRAVRFGRGQYRLSQTSGLASSKSWCGVPRYLFRAMFEQSIAITKACLSMNEESLFRARWEFNYLKGQFIEARILDKEAASPVRGISV